jgi:asparagine synthase (glutamine-hydrolysing)
VCGIAGIVDLGRGTDAGVLNATVSAMADTLYHRGPDDSGTWVAAEAGVALGHCRLAIVDLSPTGHQPMISRCERYVLVYNGEIYNFEELRRELEECGHSFRGHSDTEVLLEACAEWGIDQAVRRLLGMFAFALWDREARTLTLVRDRLGIKPLYWGRFGDIFLFGSELKALRRHAAWRPEIDRASLAAYVRRQYVPAPHTIYKGAHKLQPGHILTLHADGRLADGCYWSLREIARAAKDDRARMAPGEGVDELERLLSDAVRRHMVADVPLGAFFSGGIDSSLVVALMQAQSTRPVRTYSLGFTEADFDEAPYSKAIARHLGTQHTEFYVSPSDALEILPTLPMWYDEPLADSSQLPTIIVSRLARKDVTVALSGDGGDEIFGGYRRYYRADRLRRSLASTPTIGRGAAARMLDALADGEGVLGRALPQRWRSLSARRTLHRLAACVGATDDTSLYRALVSQVNDPGAYLLQAEEHKGPFWDHTIADDIPNFLERMGYLDTVTSLPDQMLTKVDRASMAASLEARVPLLDHRVVEFAWKLPPPMKFQSPRDNKVLLRTILYRHVPRELVDRRKRGFGLPIRAWLRGALRDWAEESLAERRLAENGLFDPTAIRAIWSEHLSGQANWERLLWRVLIFQAWQEHQTAGPLGGVQPLPRAPSAPSLSLRRASEGPGSHPQESVLQKRDDATGGARSCR